MAKKIVLETTADIVKKHEAKITTMTDAEKTLAIAEQLEAVEVRDKQKVFYQAKEVAITQQKQAGVLLVETARNDAKAQLEEVEKKWEDAAATGTWEINGL